MILRLTKILLSQSKVCHLNYQRAPISKLCLYYLYYFVHVTVLWLVTVCCLSHPSDRRRYPCYLITPVSSTSRHSLSYREHPACEGTTEKLVSSIWPQHTVRPALSPQRSRSCQRQCQHMPCVAACAHTHTHITLTTTSTPLTFLVLLMLTKKEHTHF